MGRNDFIMTIDSDTEDISSSHSQPKKGKLEADEDAHLNSELTFDLSGDPSLDAGGYENDLQDIVKVGSKPQPISVDDIIARRKLDNMTRKRKRVVNDTDSSIESDAEELSEDGDDTEDPLATSSEEDEVADTDENAASSASENDDNNSDDTEPEDQAEVDRKAAFFDSEVTAAEAHSSFLTMNLSRSILRALASLEFKTPTPIQAATIPVALLGKDVVGRAVTGSGKTAAFTVPMLERLLYREKGKQAAATRCLVLVPTRELAVQCFQVATKLATYTDIRFCLIVGGLSLKSQETELRGRPDVVIATPGRLIDHIRNSPSFTLDALDILVLDEADRMLSDGFSEELTEIIRSCPPSRQTMLFSATMTDSVDELVKISLNKPVRLFVDPKRRTAIELVQEFVRIRAGKEQERSAVLVTLCKRTFKSGVIVFFRTKKLAHQIRILFSLLGMRCQELHGELTQEQRLQALQNFRNGSADYLLATDLASRGLDIKGIDTVINYDMPGQLEQYLHRVGRTARAGKRGRSVTLVGESDRKLLKAVIKHSASADQVRHRVVPPEFVSKWIARLDELKDEVSAILKEEKEEKQLRQAEMELKKGENMIEHKEEIYSRAPRTWFRDTKEKAQAKAKSAHSVAFHPKGKSSQNSTESKPKRPKDAGLSRKEKRRKLAREETEGSKDSLRKANVAIRSAKRTVRPAKIGAPGSVSARSFRSNKPRKKAKKPSRKRSVSKKGSAF